MNVIYKIWTSIRDVIKTTNLTIIIGTAFIVMSGMLLVLFFGHEHQKREMMSVVQEGRVVATKMRYYSELAEYARTRTRLTSQIINTEDVFEQDELNQRLELFAGKYAEARQVLKSLPLNEAENQIQTEQDLMVSVILPAQREAVSLAIDGDEASRKKAKKILYEIVFPGQTRLVDLFLNLIVLQQRHIDELAKQSKISMDKTEYQQTWFAAAILFFFIIIAVLVIRRARSIQIELEQSQEDLEIRVKHRTADLIDARNEAERSNQAKSEFLSSMSHELRTPMNAILGFAQLLKHDDGLGNEQQDSIHEILNAGNHLLELINDVLDLARIESGHIDLSLEPVELTHLVDECFTLVTPVAKKYGISISHGDMGGHFVRADRTRLKQVLLNLLTNAIKYNRKQGSAELHVTPVNKTEIRITITDTGNGIDEEKLEELFQPFKRLDAENSEIEGTGIGLTITRSLVEMMGGRVSVDSEPGTGSRFWVELPMETFSLPEEHHDADEDMTENSVVVKEQQHTILYIEDNPANLKLVSHILARRQHINLITAHEAEFGLELASVHQPGLILLDINMPGMDGYQALSVLQSDERLKEIPVVAVTANAMPKDIERGKAAGFSDYLTKPLNVASFLETVEYYLSCKQS